MEPRPIARLECGADRLFVEVIQEIAPRQLCWARPLAVWLEAADGEGTVHPATDEPDILWPLPDFYPALDSEVLALLPIFVAAADGGAAERRPQSEGSLVRRFLDRLWQHHQHLRSAADAG